MSSKDENLAIVSVGRLCLVSVLFGLTIASLLPILLNIARLERTADVLLVPGGILTSLSNAKEAAPHPLLLIAGNAIFYALCLFGLCLAARRWFTLRAVRSSMWTFGLTAVILVALACVPKLDPLWPHGMAGLQAQEAKLKSVIRSDSTIDQIRAALQQESIPLHEETEESAREIMRNPKTQIVASAGDRLIFSRFRTDAVQYPCGYDLQVVVLFYPDGKIKDRYIAPLAICP